jgi:hypothetical protein
MSRRFRPFLCGLLGLGLAAGAAQAQLTLPGAAPAAAQGASAATKPKIKTATAPKKETAAKPGPAPGIEGLAGRPLLLNGKTGLMQISGDDAKATIDKLQLAGESVSDASQRCIVDIVAEKPIEATSVGRPDGLQRFEAEIPACPFAFDALDGAALVPPQITACVFKAADCQTSPSGLWGPDGASLVGDAPKFLKERAQAEKEMGKVLEAIEGIANPEAANLVRDQNGFAGARDDMCRDYLKESIHGYCALRLTQARTALLATRLAEFRAKVAANPDKGSKKHTSDKKKK